MFFEGVSKKGTFPHQDLSLIMKNKVDILLWSIFFKYQNPQKIDLVTDHGKIRSAILKIQNKSFGKGDKFYYYWIITIFDQNYDLNSNKNQEKLNLGSDLRDLIDVYGRKPIEFKIKNNFEKEFKKLHQFTKVYKLVDKKNESMGEILKTSNEFDCDIHIKTDSFQIKKKLVTTDNTNFRSIQESIKNSTVLTGIGTFNRLPDNEINRFMINLR